MIDSRWDKISTLKNLSENQIHIWLLDIPKLSNSDKSFDCILSNDEIEKKNRFHFLKDKVVYSTTRGVLRKLLQKYLDLDNEVIQFEYNYYGKPSLNNNIKSNLKFNVSHSKEIALLAFTLDDEIGVDVEYINDQLVTREIAEKYFSIFESKELFKKNLAKQKTAFFNIWTRKEAYIKARGKGLSIPLDSFDVSLDIQNPTILRSEDTINLKKVFLNNLTINSRYCAAILNIGHKKDICQFEYLANVV